MPSVWVPAFARTRGSGLPVAFTVLPDDVAEAGEGEMASDDGYVFVFDGLKEGASGLVGEGPVMVEVAVPSVLGDLGGMDEDVAFYEGPAGLGKRRGRSYGPGCGRGCGWRGLPG